jgi:hypothetical protein
LSSPSAPGGEVRKGERRLIAVGEQRLAAQPGRHEAGEALAVDCHDGGNDAELGEDLERLGALASKDEVAGGAGGQETGDALDDPDEDGKQPRVQAAISSHHRVGGEITSWKR